MRITSPLQLDLPYFHATAREIIEGTFSKTPSAFTHDYPISDALTLATSFNLISVRPGRLCLASLIAGLLQVRKAVFYSLVTTTNFDVLDDAIGPGSLDAAKIIPTKVGGEFSSAEPATFQPPEPARASQNDNKDPPLSPEVTETCRILLSRIIEHFTPILFTPPATPHMECTDVFAETWGSLVILPAIEDNGVYKPLEMLATLKDMDWARLGLCPSCVEEKRKEWTEEQMNIWTLMEDWLRVSGK